MHRRILTVLLSALLAVGLGAGPAAALSSADEPVPTWYLALGDSYGAGYQPGTGVDLTGGYAGPVLDAYSELAPGAQLHNLSCPGETIGSFLDGGRFCDYEGSQIDAALAFLQEHPQTRLITLDIGGNDVQTCVSKSTGGIDLICLQQGMATIQSRLPGLIAQLQDTAPDAQIVLTNYPDVFLAAWLRGGSGEALARTSVTLVGNLNAIYEQAATTAEVDFADVTDAFRTTDFDTMVDDPTYGKIPVNVSMVCSLTWMCAQGDIHPNDDGYALIASVIVAMLEEPRASEPTSTTTTEPTTSTSPTSTSTTTTEPTTSTSPIPTSTSTSETASTTVTASTRPDVATSEEAVPGDGPRTPAVVQTDGAAPGGAPVLLVLLLFGVGSVTLSLGAARRRSAARH